MGFQHHYLSTEEQKKEFISLSLKSKVDVLLWRDYLEIFGLVREGLNTFLNKSLSFLRFKGYQDAFL